jgi:hypothetical protein
MNDLTLNYITAKSNLARIQFEMDKAIYALGLAKGEIIQAMRDKQIRETPLDDNTVLVLWEKKVVDWRHYNPREDDPPKHTEYSLSESKIIRKAEVA